MDEPMISAGDDGQPSRAGSRSPDGGPERTPDPVVMAIWESVERLRDTVENDHDHRLRRIERDIRWVTLLLAAQIMALIGAAISIIAGEG